MAADDHVPYFNAPVVLVAVEVRFPGEMGALVPASVQPALHEVLGDDEWISEQVLQPTLNVNLGGAGPLASGAVLGSGGVPPPGTILRFALRDRTMAVALTSASVTVETTRYQNWPQFRTILEKAIRGTGELLRPEGVIRTGVRYIDEIRVHGVKDNADWADWLSPVALPPAADAMTRGSHPPVNWMGAAQYEIGQERFVVLRYGPQPAQPGFAVNPDGPLRRPKPEGPFFLLDFDSFWQPAEIPRWDGPAAPDVRRSSKAGPGALR